jgi:hypothetical protein
LKIFPIVSKYWMYRGRSNPHERAMAAICSGVAVLPARREAGFPLGITWNMRNVKIETRKRTISVWKPLRTAKRVTGPLS